MKDRLSNIIPLLLGLFAMGLAGCEEKPSSASQASAAKLSVASYDPTRELYRELNPAFEAFYKRTVGRNASVETDHGPSGKQARDVAAGKQTDVVALGIETDIDTVARAGLIPADWRDRLPNGSVPYYSAIAFMVRKGNPKSIKTWEDLARPEVAVVTADPRTSAGARWAYLSAWGHALRKAQAAGEPAQTAESAARKFTATIYDDAVLDAGARGSSTRFVQQQTGDVLVQWESEILQIANDPAAGSQFEVVVPSDSISIEVPIAVVDKQARAHGVLDLAQAYAKYHFSDEAQEIFARRFNRPFNPAIAAKYATKLPPIQSFRFKDHFGDWPTATKKHFAAGGELDGMRKK